MSVNAKEKRMLQEMWNKAPEGGKGELPDGTYQFKITKAWLHFTKNGKPQFKMKLKVVGGSDDLIGQEVEIHDNLETEENMGWLKSRLRRLNVALPSDFDEIEDGTLSEELVGKVFEGQVKTKNDFMNVYTNRLIGEAPEAEATGKKAAKEEEEEAEESTGSDIEEGMDVTWGNGKTGEVIEILADDQQARVKKEDGTVVRVALNLLSAVEAAKEEEEEEEEADDEKPAKKKKDDEEDEDDDGDDEFVLPDADDVKDMSAPDVKKAIKALGFEPGDIKNARGVLHAFCALAENPKAKIEVTEINPLAEALGVEFKKGTAMKDMLKALSAAVEEKLEG